MENGPPGGFSLARALAQVSLQDLTSGDRQKDSFLSQLLKHRAQLGCGGEFVPTATSSLQGLMLWRPEAPGLLLLLCSLALQGACIGKPLRALSFSKTQWLQASMLLLVGRLQTLSFPSSMAIDLIFINLKIVNPELMIKVFPAVLFKNHFFSFFFFLSKSQKCFKNDTQGWGCCLVSRVFVWQAQSLGFDAQRHVTIHGYIGL